MTPIPTDPPLRFNGDEAAMAEPLDFKAGSRPVARAPRLGRRNLTITSIMPPGQLAS